MTRTRRELLYHVVATDPEPPNVAYQPVSPDGWREAGEAWLDAQYPADPD